MWPVDHARPEERVPRAPERITWGGWVVIVVALLLIVALAARAADRYPGGWAPVIWQHSVTLSCGV